MTNNDQDIEISEIEYGWIISISRACDEFFIKRGMTSK